LQSFTIFVTSPVNSPLSRSSAERRANGMHLDADMVGGQAHDPLGIGGRHATARVFKAARKPVDRESSIGFEHHLDDARVFEILRNRRSRCRAQHARARGESFRPK
jgi:hypothetical protein